MNKYLDGVLVVEGKSDASILSSFIKTPIFVTNGFDINNKLVKLLKNIEQNSKVYILTDEDDSGLKICEKLAKQLQKPIILHILTNNYSSSKKHGVAEICYEVLYDFFNQYFVDKNEFNSDIDEATIYRVGKKLIQENFDFPYNSIKGILKCFKALRLTKKDLVNLYGN